MICPFCQDEIKIDTTGAIALVHICGKTKLGFFVVDLRLLGNVGLLKGEDESNG